MKALSIMIVLLLFNICISTVGRSGLMDSSGYYESELINVPASLYNVTNQSSADYEALSVDLWAVMGNTLTFSWAYQYANTIGVGDEVSYFITALNIVLVVLIAISFIELVFYKGSDILS